jgi:2-desacetyl-2-hydroxyethyl bacteriochlorophyllide A dehydrogenase
MKRILFREDATVELQESTTPPIPDGCVRVEQHFSLISAGTELLKLRGAMGKIASEKVGYSGVGRIVGGTMPTGFTMGDEVFTRGPHQDIVDIPTDTALYNFVKVDPRHAKSSTFLELGKVALHGLHRANIQLGDSILVFGLGIVGNLAAQLASLATGAKVYALDPIAERRALVEKIGIQAFDPSLKTDIDTLRELLGFGADVVVEASGSQNALASSFQLAAPRGQIILVAGHYGTREIDLKSDFQDKELSLIAARRLEQTNRSMADRWTVSECRREFYHFLSSGKVSVDELISDIVPPHRAAEMYCRLLKREPGVIGVVFDWSMQ